MYVWPVDIHLGFCTNSYIFRILLKRYDSDISVYVGSHTKLSLEHSCNNTYNLFLNRYDSGHLSKISSCGHSTWPVHKKNVWRNPYKGVKMSQTINHTYDVLLHIIH
jgi:hypothetical protein